jgi:ABC-type transport system involved in multi-copper enzyme maturation permease subunit
MNPILGRELLEVLRRRRAVALQLCLGLACGLLVLMRWPTEGAADLTGVRAQQVLRVFGYGLMAGILLLVPAFPATAIVRERIKGTLALLLNSPLSPVSIYLGKLGGIFGFTLILLAMTLPAAAACYLLGGTGAQGGAASLYGVLILATLQLATLSLLVSSYARSTDGALRLSYALVLTVSVLTLVPYVLLHGGGGLPAGAADFLRTLSPIPAVMQVLGQGDVGSHGMTAGAQGGLPLAARYAINVVLLSLLFAVLTIRRLNHRLLDQARASGIMTQDRSMMEQVGRRLVFLIDPQRRSGSMSLWINPVLVKELRSRRFGRSHWILRLVAICAILSLGLSHIALAGVLGWGPESIGAVLVGLQVALLILFAPSLAAGLVSSERESGSWQLLRMTPLSSGAILRGKLMSVAWPLLLLMCATLPGYITMMATRPALIGQMERVVICLALTAVFAVLVSAAASTLFRSTAASTTASYLILLAVCVGPLLIWLGQEAPFGYDTVRACLLIDPVAAALQAADTPYFTEYELLPANWWIIGSSCVALLLFLRIRTWQLYRPE